MEVATAPTTADEVPRARRLAVGLLTGYKRWISPLLPPSCRFSPTCSEYARLAILEHGVPRGVLFAAGRVCRCHPLAAGGIDLPRTRERAGEAASS
ncbi:MAG: membrane protein insertion efficiency factor YidD [Acidobacteria bacterium]|nr:MAG: membrane protein insertion efficiency factor YidD [Acidobacteriota bacterium]REJ99605.1 MAG: membrane protein insertion efficiency factor YidD [Acidobacteriota bacterium]